MPEPEHRGGRRQPKTREVDETLSARELRREARRLERRRGRRKIVLATVAALALIAASVAGSWWWFQRPEPATPSVDLPADQGASTLVAVTDRDQLLAAWLVSAHPTHADRVVVLPPSLLAVVPGYGEQALTEAYAFADIDLVGLTITNLLGVRLDAIVNLTVEDLSRVLIQPIDIDIPDPLMVRDGNIERIAIAAGNQPRDASQIATLLAERGTGDELDLLFRQAKTAEGLLAGIRNDASLADRLTANAPGIATQTLLAAAQDDAALVTTLPVSRADALSADLENYVFNASDVATYVEQAFPHLAMAPEPRTVVEILNGNGGIGVTAPVAEQLVLAGYRVLKTDNAARDDYPTTQVIAQGRQHQQEALEIQRLLGLGEVLLEIRQPSGVFDVVIIVGRDI